MSKRGRQIVSMRRAANVKMTLSVCMSNISLKLHGKVHWRVYDVESV